MSKFDTLLMHYGYDDPMQMLEDATFDSVAPGICSNPGCDYSTEVEPDQDRGWCEECETQTVQSCLVMMGMI
jgi:hypothetical protein